MKPDEFFRGRDLLVVAVVKQAKAPDAAIQTRHAVFGREGHREQLDAVRQLILVVGDLSGVPAESHLRGAVDEQGDFLRRR